MGNSDKSGKNRDSSSAGSPQEMQLQLWEINEVIIARDYTATQTGAGLYYTLRTSRQDLPAGFLHIDW
ncbi:hypothetical protein NOR_05056 [Metarhizium rileyi]|uniref:Uncharacterized protein n=1 Tax=Metarhizium rileyi (strain RCEF 4871) TaxID=1649241 RepID=A0A167DCL3_METRR|nr:hypothetical protein NOR_05056 [Metarhizium rileyi RCEF 4871]